MICTVYTTGRHRGTRTQVRGTYGEGRYFTQACICGVRAGVIADLLRANNGS